MQYSAVLFRKWGLKTSEESLSYVPEIEEYYVFTLFLI